MDITIRHESGGVTDVTGPLALDLWLLAQANPQNTNHKLRTSLNRQTCKRFSQEPKLIAQSPYCKNSAGRPVSRSILLAIGGCVENRFPKFIPSSGWIINKCAVEGDAAIGTRRE